VHFLARLLLKTLRPSARAFFEEGRAEGMSWAELIHGYAYARWPYLYIGGATGRRTAAGILLLPLILLLARHRPPFPPKNRPHPDWADSYHGKAVPLEEASRLVRVDRAVELRDLEQVVPYALARDIVLKNPERITLLDCPCRVVREKHCEPVSVCLIVGEPFASFILEHPPGRAPALTAAAGGRLRTGGDARGHVHHAFFKEAMLGRFYAICNCCSCCCGAMQAQRHGIPMLCSSGFLCRVDAEACVGCGLCLSSCQFQALSVRDKRCTVDVSKCMGCGVCASHCAKSALSLVRAPEKGEPLEIRKLLGAA
jgi:ferredoxin